MSKLITVSPSPHNYGKDTVERLMYGVLIALLPTLAASIYFYGIGAIVVTLTAIVSSLMFEFLITKYMLKRKPSLFDGSALITGLLLAFNVPSNLPIWIIIIGSLVAIGVGKMSFGGLGNNPFNPALVGRVFLLISFPVQMTSWPTPIVSRMAYTDADTGATPLAIVSEKIGNGEKFSEIDIPSYSQMFLGNMGGSLGEVAAVALLLGLAYLLIKKIITWHIPVSILGSVTILTGIMWLINPNEYADPVFHILTGGMLLGAIFMATDYVTSPMSKKGMLIFGTMIGILTVVIRVFGAYPEGMSFAILIMNAFVPLINMYVKPKRFGEVVKNGK